MITARPVNPAGTRVLMGTLTDGVLVHEALRAVATQFGIQTATVDLLGGLTEVELAAFDFIRQERLPPKVFRAAMEIVAGHGTVSLLDDQPHIHLHCALALRDDAAPNGIAMIGGHVARAVVFAVEFTLTAYDGAPVHRAAHATTGLKLWDLPPVNAPNVDAE